MSARSCIGELVADGGLSREQGRYFEALHEKLSAKHRAQFGDEAADAMAGQALGRKLAGDAALRRRQLLLQVSRQKAALDAMATYKGKRGDWSLGKAAEALMARDDRAPYANVEYRERRRRNQALALMTEVMQRHSRNLLGEARDKAGLRDLAREAFGEASGNRSASEFAEAWGAASEQLRRQFNAAGGAIGKLERWGLPQSHDSRKVAKAGYDAWRAAEMPRLDRARMIDETTGAPFDDAALNAALRDVFETIRTDGWAKREEGGFALGKVGNRRQESRFLIYRSADDWLASHEQFGGSASVYDAMMNHVHSMARDIAAMEVLGPNPAATVRWLQDVLRKSAATEHGAGSTAVDKAGASADRLGELYAEFAGLNRGARSQLLAVAGSSLRSWQVATKLGSAAVTAAPTDAATQALTRAFNGLPVRTMAADYLKQLASEGNRAQASRLGFVAEQSTASLATQARFLGEELTGEFNARLAEGVMRASGLNMITEVGRAAFGMEALGHITDESVKRWGKLDGRFRGMLERYGFDEAGWDSLRATPLEEMGGAPWIRPENVEDPTLADRMMEMIYSETDFAVVTAGLRARSVISWARKGTVMGELGRTFFQFKAFPVAAMMLHGGRMLAQQGATNKALYGAAFASALTVGGYIALQSSEVLKGRDPMPMNKRTLIASFEKGGALGVYGDFLFSTTNQYGRAASSVFLGPSMQTLDAVSGLALGAPLLALEGEEKNHGGQAVRTLRGEIPGGSLWYLRLAKDRLLLDQLQEAMDPNYRQSWRRLDRFAAERGQDYWWAPGDDAPERAPDWGNAQRGEAAN